MENVILTILIIAFCVYFFRRDNKVYKFRAYITILIYSKGCEMRDGEASYQDISYLLNMLNNISYEKMLFSFKPLKMEYWFTEEELKLLGYESRRLD